MADLCLHSNGVLSGIRARFSLLDREVAVFRPVELSLALDSRIHYRILSKISKPLRQRHLVQSESNVDGVPLHLVQQKSPTPIAPAPPKQAARDGPCNGPKQKPNNHRSETIADEICVMHNRASSCVWKDKNGGKCPRHHVCVVCTSPQHTASTCPQKSTK